MLEPINDKWLGKILCCGTQLVSRHREALFRDLAEQAVLARNPGTWSITVGLGAQSCHGSPPPVDSPLAQKPSYSTSLTLSASFSRRQGSCCCFVLEEMQSEHSTYPGVPSDLLNSYLQDLSDSSLLSPRTTLSFYLLPGGACSWDKGHMCIQFRQPPRRELWPTSVSVLLGTREVKWAKLGPSQNVRDF